jgi:deoxyribonuclease V
VAGGDVAFTRDGKHLIAGWVVWDIDAQAVVETAVALLPVRFPYVPGLLSFREAPALIAAARKLEIEPDAFMFDGQGLAHPRRFGIACHVGLLIDRPSLGCAKSRLCGEADAPAAARGSSQPLHLDGRTLGRVVRTREGVKPVFVSVGHRMTLQNAVRLTLRCCTKYRLPEPTRLAHQLVTSCREDT